MSPHNPSRQSASTIDLLSLQKKRFFDIQRDVCLEYTRDEADFHLWSNHNQMRVPTDFRFCFLLIVEQPLRLLIELRPIVFSACRREIYLCSPSPTALLDSVFLHCTVLFVKGSHRQDLNPAPQLTRLHFYHQIAEEGNVISTGNQLQCPAGFCFLKLKIPTRSLLSFHFSNEYLPALLRWFSTLISKKSPSSS